MKLFIKVGVVSKFAGATKNNKRRGFYTPAVFVEGQTGNISGGFPRILETIRQKKLLGIEEAVFKMTGAAADHFQIKNRGRLYQNYAADITVFDPERVCDNTTLHETTRAPDGIEHVFINGVQTVSRGKILEGVKAGVALRR